MKKLISALICLILLTSVCFADTGITPVDGEEIEIDENLVDIEDMPIEEPTEPEVVIHEVVPENVEDLTINANEVVLYSLLPEEDVYPSGAPLEGGVYMHLDTDELGDILVYVPVDYQYDSFTKNSNGQPINITASTITGYSFDGNDYNIRWQTWGVPMYRPVNYTGGVQYQELTVNEILGTNVGFWAQGGVSYNYMLLYIILGGLILLIALKIVGK